MEWRQFVINLESIEPQLIEEVLCRHGAQAVTLSAAGDEPVLEPAPGTTPLWSDTRMSALFSAETDFALLQADLRQSLNVETLPEHSVELLPDREWEKEWLTEFRPTRFGRRLWVAPPGHAVNADDAVVVRLSPGLAFGTGTHATTALCLEWLDAIDPGERTLLDFGCGSGILAIAALKLGASSALAVDIDLQAITAARQNASINAVGDRLETTMHFDRADRQFDIVVANILAGTLVDCAGALCNCLRTGGNLALSGILTEQVDDVAAAYRHCIEFAAPASRDNWACLSGTKF